MKPSIIENPAKHQCVRLCVCVWVGGRAGSHCSLMPFACFSHHQSALGTQLLILIEIKKCSCRGRGGPQISKHRFPFSRHIIGWNASVGWSHSADLRSSSHTFAHTNHTDSQLLTLIERSHCGVCQVKEFAFASLRLWKYLTRAFFFFF